MDVCRPGALSLRAFRRIGVEGERRSAEDAVAELGTFPYLRDSSACDGCMQCVDECPVAVLSLTQGVEPISHSSRALRV
jgi:ferredoxin